MRKIKHFEIAVKGMVQKVAFRQFVKWLAKKYRIHGKVENLDNYDEDVLITIEAGEAGINRFLHRLRNPTAEDKKRTAAKIERIIAEEMPCTGEFKNKAFKIVSGENEIAERLDDGLVLLKHLQGLYDETGKFRKDAKSGFGDIKMEIRLLNNELNKNFTSLGAKIDGNFSSLDKKYGSVSKTLKSMDKNLEKIVAKI